MAMLFRDRSLSDLIGFTYSKVPPREAVADFIAHVTAVGEALAREGQHGPATVGVFLDGENAWEHYPQSGREFLDRLYGVLEASDDIETVTLSEAALGARGPALPRIHSGSWIEASYRIWIGHREDRQAWTALGRTRDAVKATERSGALGGERLAVAMKHIHAAEASDWFWWYGEDFSTELATEFDGLFRGHVIRASLLAGANPPAEALVPIKRAGLAAAGLEAKPLREPTLLMTPVLDGRETTYFEWQGSGLHRPGQHGGSMYGGAQAFQALYYGFDLDALYLRLDPSESPERTAEVAAQVRVTVLAADRQMAVEFVLAPDGVLRSGLRGTEEVGRAAFRSVLEIALPFASLGLVPKARVALAVHSLRGGVEVERLPRYGFLPLVVPDADFEHVNWRV